MNASVPLSLKSLQIIVLAMMAGVLVFAVIAVAIGSRNPPQPELARLLMPILVLVGVVELPAYFVVRRASVASLRRSLEVDPPADDSDARVMTTFATLTIIGSAMAEGFGLFGSVIFLLTSEWPVLAAPAIALVVLVLRIPTGGKLSDFAGELAFDSGRHDGTPGRWEP